MNLPRPSGPLPSGWSTRALDRHAYAHDASHYLLTPTAVAVPDTVQAVADLLRHAAARGESVTFRSGGTSLSGQAVTDGILADVRKGFRGHVVHDGGRSITCRPGTTVRQANIALARHGYRLGPDPASELACTIGGIVANNSSGMSCGVRHGVYRTIRGLTVVLADGTVVETGGPDADDRLRRERHDLHEGLLRLRDRVRRDRESVAVLARQFAMKNTMGYGLNAFVDFDAPADILTHLMVGSEGTLGFLAEATFATVATMPHAATGLLLFPTLGEAVAAVPDLVDAGASAVELMDATALRVAQSFVDAPNQIRRLEIAEQTALLVEVQADDLDGLADRRGIIGRITDRLTLIDPAPLSADPVTRQRLWHLRKGLYTAVAEARPSGTSALLEDIGVPLDTLHAACSDLTELLRRYRYEQAVIFGHAKDGNLHFMITERFDDPAGLRRYREFTDELVDLVLGHGGTLKAEHGTGRIMAAFVERQFGSELYAVMKEVKHLFDPRGVLNPGTILTDDPDSYLQNLKTAPSVEAEVDRCVECGYCETVCPSKDLTLTPRQRIVVRRAIASAEARGERGLAQELTSDFDYAGIDTCAADGMCATSCPVSIDTGDLVRRLRAERQPRVAQIIGTGAARHWKAVTVAGATALSVAGRTPGQIPAHATALARTIIGHELVPQYQRGLPGGGRRRSAVATPTDAVPDAIYLPACLNGLFGSPGGGVQAAVIRIAEHVGVTFAIPSDIDALCCGTPWKSKGLTAGYEVMRRRVLSALGTQEQRLSAVPLLTDSSSCAHGLTDLVAARPVLDVVDYVADHLLDRITVRRRLGSLLLHPTCSGVRAGRDSLRRIGERLADRVVVPDTWGCCGFAGDRGLLHPELTASATRAEAAETAGIPADAYATDNLTCGIGMQRATDRPYQHILELLADALD